jgi:hypothetical protein
MLTQVHDFFFFFIIDQAKYKLQITNLQVLKAKWSDLLVKGSLYTWKLQHASSGHRQHLLVILGSARCHCNQERCQRAQIRHHVVLEQL